MDTSIEKILSELVAKVAEHFKFDSEDSLAAVAQSRIANELALVGNVRNLSIDQICAEVYNEIAVAE